jgi:hypothetical protein
MSSPGQVLTESIDNAISKNMIRFEASLFCQLLTVLFIGLKLTGHIAWSWIWVLSPLWGPAAVLFVAAIVVTFWLWMAD